ncbi:PREDICTED: amiloride-sensitive sodium channel subunit delta [Galeopterus variegatus]|uniref:Amiloride-sensitive sodium channel subunit delta n=1 Tax=Galeopterus variegatus TaxID=482537 RepID=A0ABM0R6Z8_GALVR|nr:PREDICTED: amiloride-sensitive sodium channel subunit delta [Galeopterus variegatus]
MVPGVDTPGRLAFSTPSGLTQPHAGATVHTAGAGPGTWNPPEEGRGERLVELHGSFRELLTFFCTNATIHGAIRLVCSNQNRPGTWNPPEVGRGERLVELHGSFRELLTFFCANATIHGAIRLVCSNQNRLKTTSWGLLFLGALGTLYWQFGLLFEQYWRYPVIMTVSVHSERKLFPLVTLCDMNPHRPSTIHHHLQALDEFAQENIYSLYKFNFSRGRDTPFADIPGPKPGFQLDRRIQLQRLSHLGSQYKVGFRLCNSTGGDCFYRAYSSGVTAVREWYRFHYVNILALLPTAHEDSHQSHGSHFVFSCRYDSKDCQARHFQTFHHPTYGSCYTFNGNWTAQRPGITHGISLVLRAEQQDHLPLLSTEAGIKVMVHGHHHPPFLEHHGFSIRPGTETTIGIREDEVHRLGSPYGHCTDGVEGVDVLLLYNTSYTMQACLVSCFQQLMVETCSCGYYFYPLPVGAEYCSYARHPAWGHCFYRLHQDLETRRLPCSSRCPRPCRESSFKLFAGTSRWPSAKSTDWILAVLGERGPRGQSQRKSNVAKVNIFYQELNYRTVDETPVYSVPQLLSAMGSLWSLWFGSSVLSVLELLELLLDATALALLLGFRRFRGASTALGAPHTMPEAGVCPPSTGTPNDVQGPGQPRLPQMFPGALAGVWAEELG